MEADELIALLRLKPLAEEGGFYRETYRAKGVIPKDALPMHGGKRAHSTLIFYLVTPEEFSGLHMVKSDEILNFYRGDPVKMIQIDDAGALKEVILGSSFEDGHQLQTVVPQGIWQGTKLVESGKWALMGCTVAPGFEFEDFETKSRAQLIDAFPEHRGVIELYTHG